MSFLFAMLCWSAFENSPETPAKKRRYNLATSFARK